MSKHQTFSQDGRFIATASWDNTVKLWDAATHRPVHTFIGHTDRVTCAAFSPDSKTLVSAAGNEVKAWDPEQWDQNPQVLHTRTDRWRKRFHCAFIFAPDGSLYQLVQNATSHVLTLVSLRENSSRKPWTVPDNTSGTALSPDGNTLAIGLADGRVILRDARSGHEQWTVPPPFRPAFVTHADAQGIGFSPDGKRIAVAVGDPAIVTVWDLATRRQIGHFQHSNHAQHIAFSPDSRTLAVANWQGLVYLWNIEAHRGEVKSQDLVSWRAHTKSVVDVAFSADGRTLATGSEDHTVKLWNVETHREMITLRDHQDDVRGVAFSPDGTTLATTGYDNKVFLYYADRPN